MKASGATERPGDSATRGAAGRPLVVLIPDLVSWVLGAWAREIAEQCGGDCDFAIFPSGEIGRRPEAFSALLRAADVVHCLSPWDFAGVQSCIRAEGADHVCAIVSIHHIARLEDVRPCLAADRIAVMSEEVREALGAAGVPQRKLFLLRKGVDSAFYRRRDRAAARAQLGLPEEAFVVGLSAKATSDQAGRKGTDVLFGALLRLASGPEPAVHLAITGPGWEPLIESEPPFPVHRHSFLPREAMPGFYSAIDAYVSTARVEGGPLPIFEAMSCGTPTISTPVGMVRDLVRNEAEGLVVPIGDAGRTAQAIERLRRDSALATALGRAGRDAVAQRLNFRGTAARAQAHALYGAKDIQPRRGVVGGPTPAELARLNAELEASDAERWRERVTRSDRSRHLARTVKRPRGAGAEEVAYVDLETLGIDALAVVLDLGCGTGQLSVPLLELRRRVVSLDLDRGRLDELRDACGDKGLTADALIADAAALPCGSGTFDGVVCREVIEHIDAPGPVLAEIHRVLKPGGRLCVSVPSAHTERYFQRVDSRWLAMAGHVQVFPGARMCELLASRGFRVFKVEGRGCFYSLFWFVHTLARTSHDGTGRIQDHFRLSRAVHRAWGLLGNGRLKRGVERIGNALFPKSYVYYAERTDEEERICNADL